MCCLFCYDSCRIICFAESPGTQGSPIFHPGASPASPGSEKFHRIKRNESCPYPECTWAGLSTHFHCLICSSFHTNKVFDSIIFELTFTDTYGYHYGTASL